MRVMVFNRSTNPSAAAAAPPFNKGGKEGAKGYRGGSESPPCERGMARRARGICTGAEPCSKSHLSRLFLLFTGSLLPSCLSFLTAAGSFVIVGIRKYK